MLAQPAATPGEALERLGGGPLAFETKLDGARVQVHKQGGRVAIFTRRLNDVTGSLPELVEGLAGLSVDGVVLDGEVLALDADGHPRAFQETMRRFGRVSADTLATLRALRKVEGR